MIIIVGDDTLVERVCVELAATGGAAVRVVFPMSSERREALHRVGVAVTARDPDSDEALLEAGAAEADAILTLSANDEQNLAVALRARMLNPRIRVVLRQFGTRIGRKIEQNLPDSTVLSLAAHSAATYAGAALDPGCFFALRFPDAADGAFVGFTRGVAADLGIESLTVADAEEHLGQRIVALGERHEPPPGALIDGPDTVVSFGPLREHGSRTVRLEGSADRPAPPLPALLRTLRHINPILRALTLGAVAFFTIALTFFHFALHQTWPGSAFDVAETMTSAGFGDSTVVSRGIAATIGAVVVMIAGTVFTSIFIGYVSAAITRAQWTALQGLRRIRGRGHVVVCGGGRTGGAVVNLLTAAGKRVVVVDSHPDPTLIRLARQSSIDLLTGDATNEDVLALCDVAHACAVVALTNSDPGNLEIALGARAIRPDVPLVVRMENRTFAQATDRLFGIATFSPAELSAPAFAGLARFPGTLGRVRYAGADHTIVQRRIDGGAQPEEPGAVPLCAWRGGRIAPLRSGAEVAAGDVVIYALPLGRPAKNGAAGRPDERLPAAGKG
jgi:Trk K+ transport system NAD-binding subunit